MLHLVQRLVLTSTQHLLHDWRGSDTNNSTIFILLSLALPHKRFLHAKLWQFICILNGKNPKISLVYPLTFFHRDEKWHTWSNKFVLCRKSAWQVTQNTSLKFTYIINSVKSWGSILSITRLSLSVKYRNDCFLTSGRCFKNQQNVYISLGLFEKKSTTLTYRTIHRQIEVSKSIYFLVSPN